VKTLGSVSQHSFHENRFLSIAGCRSENREIIPYMDIISFNMLFILKKYAITRSMIIHMAFTSIKFGMESTCISISGNDDDRAFSNF